MLMEKFVGIEVVRNDVEGNMEIVNIFEETKKVFFISGEQEYMLNRRCYFAYSSDPLAVVDNHYVDRYGEIWTKVA